MRLPAYSLERKKNLRFWRINIFEKLGCRAVFFCRNGGISQGVYKSLNLGLNTQDSKKRVLENRNRSIAAAGFQAALPVLGEQIHKTKLKVVDLTQAGCGWENRSTAIAKTDGLITGQAGLPLAITVADCLPLLFACAQGRAVAAVHAGWRGLTAGIISRCVRKFEDQLGIKACQLWVAIGPAIGPGKFEVKADTLAILTKYNSQTVVAKKQSGGSFGFDLAKAATMELMNNKIKPERIICIPECTASNSRRYFSHRRDGETGRMLGMIQIN